MNRWHLTEEIKERFTPILKDYLRKVENVTKTEFDRMENEELGLDLSDKGINPWQLVELLKQLGYEEDGRDDNGWELDFWIHMKRADNKEFVSGCEHLVIAGCGMTFELKVYIYCVDF